MHGWGTVMATDTAFLLGSLALLGSRVPPSLRLFLLSLVIFDDVGAVVVVALGYGHSLNWMVLGLGLLGLCLIGGASRLGIRGVAIYSGLGVLIWFCFDSSGVHPTLVGVVLGLMTPARGWVSDERMRAIFEKILSYPIGEHWSGDTADRHHLGQASMAARETLSPLERIGMRLHPWVGFVVMPVFALANAGVAISENVFKNPVSVAIIVSLVCGKPIGVFVLSWLSVRLGIASLLPNLNWSLIAGGSVLTGIGFTMSLFIADLAFETTSLLSVKAGVLMASVIAASLGLFALFFLTRGTPKTE
jgi:NhaA family Na+:H+ antiporter